MQLVKKTIIVLTSIIINITFAYKANSQSTPPEGVNIPPDIPEPVEETIPERQQQPVITPTPTPPPKLQIPETPRTTEPRTPSNLRFNIKKIEVLGNTVLEDEINQIVTKYQNQNPKVKAQKLAPIVRGWRQYHKYCKLDGSRFSLWYLSHRAFKVFNKEKKQDRHTAEKLKKQAFPSVPYSENRHIMVKRDKSPFDNDLIYWSKRKSKLYDGLTSKLLVKQSHTCGCCGLKFADDEAIHVHHIDGNHNNWKHKNLTVIHQSCHQYIHMSKKDEKG